MALDDYIEPETALVAAAAAAVFSPQVRGVLHRGAVYGIAGVLFVVDAIASFGRGVRSGVQASAVTSDGDTSTITPGSSH